MTHPQTSSDLQVDVCILGCGPAGFAAAMRALDLGKRICIIEKEEPGGAGVTRGALASKTMWELSKDFAVAMKTDRGYRASGVSVDYGAVRASVLAAVQEKQHQMRSQIETFSPRRFQGPGGIIFLQGTGRFLSRNEVSVELNEGGERRVRADFFLIATGSRPRDIPGAPVDQKRVINSDGILNIRSFPRRLAIIGAGIIGCEYATIFSNFRQTEVSLVDRARRVIPYEDGDVSDFVQASLEKNGVNVIHAARLRNLHKTEHHIELTLDITGGPSRILEVDMVLAAVGRAARLGDLGLERLGVSLDSGGILKTDENCRLADNIYAAGDVTHHPALVNIAEMEARYAVKHMFGRHRWPLKYDNMSTIMFFYPAVAAVGMSEKTCRRKRIAYRAAVFGGRFCDRAIAMRATDGFVKIIVTDDDRMRILGMRAVGPQVSSTVMAIAHFMDHGKGVRDALKSVWPHPTISEAIRECLRMLLGKSIMKPEAFPRDMVIRRWRPGADRAGAGDPGGV